MKSLRNYARSGIKHGSKIKKYAMKNGNNVGLMPTGPIHHLRKIYALGLSGSGARKYENGGSIG
jgi:hypothetical protein